ncbi:MAG: hypothetical protein AAFQ37_07480, partial [Bacteroidota bacterium]
MYIRFLLRIFVFLLVLGAHFEINAQNRSSELTKAHNLIVDNKFSEAAEILSQIESEEIEAKLTSSFLQATISTGNENVEKFLDYALGAGLTPVRQAHVDAIWSMGGKELSSRELTFVEGELDNNYSRIRPLALQALGYHYWLINKPKKAADYFGRVGAIDTWQLLGNFENISESGYDQDFGALANPQPDAEFQNKYGVPVKWFPLKQARYDNWVDFQYHLTTNNSIVYAQTFCESPSEQEVVFRLGTSGSVKVWVNDKLMFAERNERDNDVDSYVFSAKLKSGVNRILVQLGRSEVNGCNFMLRITDEENSLIPNLTYSNQYRPYTKETAYESRVYPNLTADYFENRIESDAADFLDFASLGQYYLVNGFYLDAQRIYEKARKKYPNSVLFVNDLALVLSNLDDDTGSSEMLELSKQLAPENPIALDRKIRLIFR